MLRKTNFLRVIFGQKREVLGEFPQKMLLNKKKHSLSVCGPLCRKKQFWLIFVPFYWFDQKKLFKQIQFFLKIFPFSNMLRKTNFLCFSVLISESHFLDKKEKFAVIFPQKCFKTTEKHSLAACGSLWGEKQFWLISVPFYRFD